MEKNVQYTKTIPQIVDPISLDGLINQLWCWLKHASDRCTCLWVRYRITVRTKGEEGEKDQGKRVWSRGGRIANMKKFNYTLEVPGVGEVVLTGSIDRVDRYNGVLRIVDYKSGKIDPAKLKIADWNSLKGDEKRRALFQILFYSHAEKDLLKTEQELIAGIISFKNTQSYVLPFGMKFEDKKYYIYGVNQEIITSYESFLIELIQEIFAISKPFTTLEE